MAVAAAHGAHPACRCRDMVAAKRGLFLSKGRIAVPAAQQVGFCSENFRKKQINYLTLPPPISCKMAHHLVLPVVVEAVGV